MNYKANSFTKVFKAVTFGFFSVGDSVYQMRKEAQELARHNTAGAQHAYTQLDISAKNLDELRKALKSGESG
jgi:hypothetical protein